MSGKQARQAIRTLQAEHAARRIAIGLGVSPSALPEITSADDAINPPVPKRTAITFDTVKRFRRTNVELRELELLTQWQKDRRNGSRKTFVLDRMFP